MSPMISAKTRKNIGSDKLIKDGTLINPVFPSLATISATRPSSRHNEYPAKVFDKIPKTVADRLNASSIFFSER